MGRGPNAKEITAERAFGTVKQIAQPLLAITDRLAGAVDSVAQRRAGQGPDHGGAHGPFARLPGRRPRRPSVRHRTRRPRRAGPRARRPTEPAAGPRRGPQRPSTADPIDVTFDPSLAPQSNEITNAVSAWNGISCNTLCLGTPTQDSTKIATWMAVRRIHVKAGASNEALPESEYTTGRMRWAKITVVGTPTTAEWIRLFGGAMGLGKTPSGSRLGHAASGKLTDNYAANHQGRNSDLYALRNPAAVW